MKAVSAVVAVLGALMTAPSAAATADEFCVQLGGAWDGHRCTAVVVSKRQAEMFMSLALPMDFIDNAVTAPVVRDYYQQLAAGWQRTGAETPRDSSARAEFEEYPGPGAVQTLIVHETFEPHGIQSNNAYRSFVFDMAAGRRLALADLFNPGVDAVTAVSAAAAPLLPPLLDAARPPHAPGTYPFTVPEWQPGPEGSGYSSDYRGFGLATNALVLYMPDAPMQRESPSPQDRLVWSMDGGTVVVRIPLSALSGVLRPEYGGGA